MAARIIRKRKKQEEIKDYEQLSLFQSIEWSTSDDYENIEGKQSKRILLSEGEGQISGASDEVITDSRTTGELFSTRNDSTVSIKPTEQLSGSLADQRESRSNSTGEIRQLDQQLGNYEIRLQDYQIVDNDERLGAKRKCELNLAAIRKVHEIEQKGIVNEEDQKVLARYSGWGGVPQIFDEANQDFIQQRNQLKELLTKEQYEMARASTLDAFYTPYLVIEKMYDMLQRLGFERGYVLDPSVGTGNFIGLTPETMRDHVIRIGCELDEMTGKIAQYLYPKQQIEITGFQNLYLQDNSIDVALSNIPFGNYKVNDKDYNRYNFDIHNYFFAKAIDKVHAGGLIMFITTTETFDGKHNHIREYMAERCDLVDAFRLPNNTFSLNGANTSVCSDIIILKKLPMKRVLEDDELEWLKVEIGFEGKSINQYFVSHPEKILGTLTTRINQYGKEVYDVEPSSSETLEEALERSVASLPIGIFEEVQEEDELINSVSENRLKADKKHLEKKNHAYFIENGELIYRNNSVLYILDKNNKDWGRLYGLTQISEATSSLIELQLSSNDENLFEEKLAELNQIYDNFVKKYGYITSRTNKAIFRDDTNFYLINSLEMVEKDEITGKKIVTKGEFFSQRTISPITRVEKCENIEDAYATVMNEYGIVRFDVIAKLLSISEEETIKQLEDNNLIIFDPENEKYQRLDEYLTGNVRHKLKVVESLVKTETKYQKNIDLLQNVVPEWLTADQIKVSAGVPWLPEEIIQQFYHEIMDTTDFYTLMYEKNSGTWKVEKRFTNNVNINSVYAVPSSDLPYIFSQPEYNGFDLMQDYLNGVIPTIRDYWQEDEKKCSRINDERTTIARDKMQQLEEKWDEWIYGTFERRELIEQIYNDKFNSYHFCEMDGSFLKCESLNPAFKPEKYQLDAAARIILRGNTLLDQVVGAGKTLEMIVAGMEMKRMGLKNKIMYVVPNSLVEQWANEFYKFYPNANILATTPNDFKKENRNMLLHRFVTNNYDAMIIPHSCFGKIPLSTTTIKKGIQKQLAELEEAIDFERDNSDYTRKRVSIKSLEKMKKTLSKRLEEISDKKDEGITFEQTGVDMLFVDEAHKFKNLMVISRNSNVAGIPSTNSQMANDMYMKTSYLNENGRGNVCFATGTPISNTMAELYNIHRYLQEDTLRERLSIYTFDAWAKTFGKIISSFEIAVDGNSFQNKLRFCKFFNIPELMNVYREVAIVMTKSQLQKEMELSENKRANFKIPRHISGKPIVVSNDPSEEMENFMNEIVERSERIHNNQVDRTEDNMLLVTNESKRASLDLRLIGREDEGRKVKNIIDNVAKIYHEYSEQKATQLIFCDLSVPNPDIWNVYDAIKQGLIEQGVDEKEIVYIHDAKTDIQRKNLFEDMRKGIKRVLLGSTQKMGAGMNVQDRLIAIHHADVPWRASDIEQRNGRAFRQGNQFDEIYEYRYVTKKSFDAYSWQLIETKASYSAQLKEQDSSFREFEEGALAMFSYAEVKAIASGNPLIKEKMELEQEVNRLQKLKSTFNRQKWDNEKKLRLLPQNLINEEKRKTNLELDAQRYEYHEVSKIEEYFKIELWNKEFKSMKEAGDFLLAYITKHFAERVDKKIGEYMGFPIYLQKEPFSKGLFKIKGTVNEYILDQGVNEIGRTNWERLTRSLNGILDSYENSRVRIEEIKKNEIILKENLSKPFVHEITLREKEKRLTEVNKLLSPEKEMNEVVFDDSQNKITSETEVETLVEHDDIEM